MEHVDKDRVLKYCDLHNHLYGCLTAEQLYEMGKKNPNPRWNIFTESYEKIFRTRIHTDRFFQDYNTPEKFSQLYYFDHRGPFPEFQAKFNLIIALVEFSYREMLDVAEQVVQNHASLGVEVAEYRIMFAKDEPRSGFEERIRHTCEGMRLGESQARKKGLSIQGRVAVSLHRNGSILENYDWIKELMQKDTLVREYLTGIDFCYVEEGFPPKDKKDFFRKMIQDNKSESSSALAILYHVGESYQDKTCFSAARWVLESARNGAHRLGHCIALGVSPKIFLGTTRKESLAERKDQLAMEIQEYDSIIKFGDFFPKQELESELNRYKSNQKIDTSNYDSTILEFPFAEREAVYLETFQNYCMSEVSKTNAVIESCPSSNYYIGMIDSPEHHPLPRFNAGRLPVTIASDDPGIFRTDITQEYRKAREMGVSDQDLERIRKDSFRYRSEKLSGRY